MNELKSFLINLSTENYTKIENFIKHQKDSNSNLEIQLLQLLQEENMHPFYYTYFLTVLLSLYPKIEYLEILLETLSTEGIYTLSQRKFLAYQIKFFRFCNPLLTNSDIVSLEKKLYLSVLNDAKENLFIQKRSKTERNNKNVVVLSDYILGERHAPTHSTLERCYTLKAKCNMDVHLVSIGENITFGWVPYYSAVNPNIDFTYDNLQNFQYLGETFHFFQPKHDISEPERLQSILSYIENVNPYYIVYIGNGSYLAEILNDFCPVVSVSTIFSKLPISNTTFTMIGRTVSPQERESSVSEILEVPFTFDLKEKQKNHSRLELGIPAELFVMAIVGNRLDMDVTDEFLSYMEHTENTYLLFLGQFNNYKGKLQKYPYLISRSCSLGRVSDVVGILECANLYVNPKRQGGGFSVMEGFRAGIPAVSIAYGDVAATIGSDFCVATYEDMLETIKKYQTDANFYSEKCHLAQLLLTKLTKGENEFKHGIEKMLDSNLFF